MSRDQTFHLYLLIGQSNMAGRGDVEPQDKQVHPRVFTLDRSCKWLLAADPIHFDKPIAGVGPGLTFGKTMADLDPSVRIGLIPCAAGGSPITVWTPGCYWDDTGSMPYDDAIQRTKLAMTQGVLKGILWHQGESDSLEGNEAALYEDRLVALIDALRTDLKAPDVPFTVATLGNFFIEDYEDHESHSEGRLVNEALRRIPQRVKRAACVESSDLDGKGDGAHFSAEAARELGRRYAQAFIGQTEPDRAKQSQTASALSVRESRPDSRRSAPNHPTTEIDLPRNEQVQHRRQALGDEKMGELTGKPPA